MILISQRGRPKRGTCHELTRSHTRISPRVRIRISSARAPDAPANSVLLHRVCWEGQGGERSGADRVRSQGGAAKCARRPQCRRPVNIMNTREAKRALPPMSPNMWVGGSERGHGPTKSITYGPHDLFTSLHFHRWDKTGTHPGPPGPGRGRAL